MSLITVSPGWQVIRLLSTAVGSPRKTRRSQGGWGRKSDWGSQLAAAMTLTAAATTTLNLLPAHRILAVVLSRCTQAYIFANIYSAGIVMAWLALATTTFITVPHTSVGCFLSSRILAIPGT